MFLFFSMPIRRSARPFARCDISAACAFAIGAPGRTVSSSIAGVPGGGNVALDDPNDLTRTVDPLAEMLLLSLKFDLLVGQARNRPTHLGDTLQFGNRVAFRQNSAWNRHYAIIVSFTTVAHLYVSCDNSRRRWNI